MHTGPAGACAWAHPRWGRAAERMLGALQVFECSTHVESAHSDRIVRERALRDGNGTREALALGAVEAQGKTKRPGTLAGTGPRMSVEGGRRLAGSFTRWGDVMVLTTQVMCVGDGQDGRARWFLLPLYGHQTGGIAPARSAGKVDDGGETAVHGGQRSCFGRRSGLIGDAQQQWR